VDGADLDIAVRIENPSLDKAFRRILKIHHFVILNQADGNIRIMIYDNTGGSAIAQAKEAS
jgi:hypothetical protein